MWLWDMVDEFLYQFGLYTSIKGLVSERTTSEIEFLKANQDVWDPAKVLFLCRTISLACISCRARHAVCAQYMYMSGC